MKINIFFATVISSILLSSNTQGQIDSSLLKTTTRDTTKPRLTMDAIYNRPFLGLGKSPISIGGYMEANWQYVGTSGITAGNQFQFRRFSIFMASTITSRIKFLAEIEYENDPSGDPADAKTGGKFEIEYAALDIELHPLFNLRGGIIVNPLGAFNQNHDGPKWEFTDRPIAMTQMLPDTWSNAGFGAYGKQYSGNWMFGYELYLTGGLNDSIIDNSQGKTFLPESNANPTRFTASASGTPMYTGKISLRNNKIGELGLSYVSDIYNTWAVEGAAVDAKRRAQIYDIDFNTTLPKINTKIITEMAWVNVQLPPDYTDQYSSKQFGGFIDIVQPILQTRILGWEHATINIAVRGEYVDWNVGYFSSTGLRMYNDLWSVMPAISFRPTSQTVIRFNYRRQFQRDITGNSIGAALGLTEGYSLGIATYF